MVTIYIEGGGDAPQLKARCRKAFNKFIQGMGFEGSMPKLVACGSRRNAYEQFCTAMKQGKKALLLVDSEAPVKKNHEFDPSGHGHIYNSAKAMLGLHLRMQLPSIAT